MSLKSWSKCVAFRLISSSLLQVTRGSLLEEMQPLSNYLNKTLKVHWENLWTQSNCEEKCHSLGCLLGEERGFCQRFEKGSQLSFLSHLPEVLQTSFCGICCYCIWLSTAQRWGSSAASSWVETHGGLTFFPHCHLPLSVLVCFVFFLPDEMAWIWEILLYPFF